MRRHLHAIDGRRSPGAGIRVVLAEAHGALRRTLRSVLDSEDGVQVVGEASDMAATMRQVCAERPDVLVLDISMSDGSTVERIERLRAAAPGMRIVAITMQRNQLLAEQALKAGATGFVLKDTADAELGEAVRWAAHDVQYTSPQLPQAVSQR